MSDNLIINNKEFNSRLLLGTGKFSAPELMKKTIKAAESEIFARFPPHILNDQF